MKYIIQYFLFLSYFEFYTNSSLNPSAKIDLPLTLLQNKKYKFKNKQIIKNLNLNFIYL